MAAATGGISTSKVTLAGGAGKPSTPAGKPTNWLSPLTAKQVVSQATQTMRNAYNPQIQGLNQQQSQAQGLSDKRTADNKYYNTWLQTQMGALNAKAQASDAQIMSMQQGLSAQQNGLYAGEPGQLVAGADARSGNVSNNAQSSAFGQDVNASEQQNTGLLNNASQNSLSTIANNEAFGTNAQANDFNVVQANQTKQLGDLQTALTTIANDRTKLNTAETGSIASEIARLQGVEVSKAQSNESFAATEQKIGLTTANTNSEIASRTAATATAQKNASTNATKAQNTQMDANRNFQLNEEKFGAATAKDMYERDNSLGPYKPSSAGVVKPLSDASQNAVYTKIDQISGEINNLVNSGYTPVQAYHLMQNGGTVAKQGSKTGTSIKPENIQLLNAAYNVRNGGTGLTSGDLAALEHVFGLTSPGTRYRVESPQTAAASSAASKAAASASNAAGAAADRVAGF